MNHPRAAEIKSNTSNLSKSEKLVGVESIESKPTATSLDFLARSLSSPVVLNNLANNWHSLKWKKKKKIKKNQQRQAMLLLIYSGNCLRRLRLAVVWNFDWLTAQSLWRSCLAPVYHLEIFRLTTFVIGKCHCFVPTSAFMYIVNLVSGPDPLTSFTLHIFA